MEEITQIIQILNEVKPGSLKLERTDLLQIKFKVSLVLIALEFDGATRNWLLEYDVELNDLMGVIINYKVKVFINTMGILLICL